MTIYVRASHVSRSRQHAECRESLRCRICPVALALQDATKQQWIVADEYAVLLRGTKKHPLPKEVVEKIKDFDETGLMIPFNFEFDLE